MARYEHTTTELPDALADGDRGPFPLAIFLHGSGECGGDDHDERVRVHGPWRTHPLNARIRDRLARYFIVAPHLPVNRPWDPASVVATLEHELARIRANHGEVVDPARIYLTGISLGGRGAIDAAPTTHLFAKVVAICPAAGAPERAAANARYLLVHRRDDYVPATRDTYRHLRALANVDHHTVDGFNHDCWSAVFASPALYDWLDGSTSARLGASCDRGYCASEPTEHVAIKHAQVPFCAAHAASYRAGDKPWVQAYRRNIGV